MVPILKRKFASDGASVAQDRPDEKPADNPCRSLFAGASCEQDTNYPARGIYRKRRPSGFNCAYPKCAIFPPHASYVRYIADDLTLRSYFTQINICETVLTLDSGAK